MFKKTLDSDDRTWIKVRTVYQILNKAGRHIPLDRKSGPNRGGPSLKDLFLNDLVTPELLTRMYYNEIWMFKRFKGPKTNVNSYISFPPTEVRDKARTPSYSHAFAIKVGNITYKMYCYQFGNICTINSVYTGLMNKFNWSPKFMRDQMVPEFHTGSVDNYLSHFSKHFGVNIITHVQNTVKHFGEKGRPSLHLVFFGEHCMYVSRDCGTKFAGKAQRIS